LLEFNNRMML